MKIQLLGLNQCSAYVFNLHIDTDNDDRIEDLVANLRIDS